LIVFTHAFSAVSIATLQLRPTLFSGGDGKARRIALIFSAAAANGTSASRRFHLTIDFDAPASRTSSNV
jgi:hypothetical protein